MQLLSKAHFLVFVTGDTIRKRGKILRYCDGVWVGYDDKGIMIGHMPYQQDEAMRDIVLDLAKSKMERFQHAG